MTGTCLSAANKHCFVLWGDLRSSIFLHNLKFYWTESHFVFKNEPLLYFSFSGYKIHTNLLDFEDHTLLTKMEVLVMEGLSLGGVAVCVCTLKTAQWSP